MTEPRKWTFTMRPPCPEWLTANDRRDRWTQARIVRDWRHAAYLHAVGAHLPKGLGRVRIDIEARFSGVPPVRDEANLHPTAKAVVDGLGPGRGPSVGYGLVRDDDWKHLNGPHITIGDPLPAGPYRTGHLVITITDLTPVPEGTTVD